MYRQVLTLKLCILCAYSTPWPGVPLTTAWRVLRLRIGGTACRYGG